MRVFPAPTDAQLQALLRPLAHEPPCGESLRHDPVFTRIRLAREEDDPLLPMRQWERPLRRADWPGIERLCTQVLLERSKDLQIAAWLCEAWVRQTGLDGLARGLWLVHGLLANFWDTLHPLVDTDADGQLDGEARIAPLAWLNDSLAVTLRRHVLLVRLHHRPHTEVSLAEWERLTSRELAAPVDAPAEGDPPELTRADIIAAARGGAASLRAGPLAHARRAQAALDAMSALLRQRLVAQAPSLSRLASVLQDIERLLLQWLGPEAVPETFPALPVGPEAGTANDSHPLMEQLAMPEDDALPVPAAAAAPALQAWRTREEAYRTLEALADFLARIEPHSPTPYLVRRAVRWGRMPLPELMSEILREEGDFERMLKFMGLQRPDA